MIQKRPPIVTILGHVDHGKTTLLDTIRATSVAAREAGGITQSIGASSVNTKSGRITFIDTPGHEAFSKMRERGASAADIAVLVCATDDGVKPQTREALEFIRAANIPFIVALTKTDLPSSNPDKAKAELMENGVLFEGLGGDTPSVLISAKQKKGLDELLEIIELTAEVNEISADTSAPLEASVIEANKDNRGVAVSLVVQNGILRQGQTVFAEGIEARIRGIFNEDNKPVKEVLPGEPALVLGFSDLPEVGASVGSSQGTPKSAAAAREVPELKEGQLGVVLKVQSAGAIDAISRSLPDNAVLLFSGVGDVSESDIFFAKSSGATVVAFESGIPGSVKRLADTEGVEARKFAIIYELVGFLEEKLTGGKAEVVGKAEIIAKFPYNNAQVAGCKIVEGKISTKDKLLLISNQEKELGEVKIISMRREKNKLEEAKAGEECGIVFAPQIPFDVGCKLFAVK